MKANPFLKGRSGVYGIYHPNVGKVYVGKTTDMYRRCSQYRYDFQNQRGTHLNDYLMSAMRKHGFDSFVFFPIEFCSELRLESCEAKWMTKLRSTDRRYGYNLRFDTKGGMIASASTSQKISDRLRREWAQGLRDGHADKLKARWAADPLRRQRQGEAFSRMKTKWVYLVKPPRGKSHTVNYQGLVRWGLESVLSSFHRKQCSEAYCKGYYVIRRLCDENET